MYRLYVKLQFFRTLEATDPSMIILKNPDCTFNGHILCSRPELKVSMFLHCAFEILNEFNIRYIYTVSSMQTS